MFSPWFRHLQAPPNQGANHPYRARGGSGRGAGRRGHGGQDTDGLYTRSNHMRILPEQAHPSKQQPYKKNSCLFVWFVVKKILK
jgi:hypothetical protein